jgi:hypothetical protein
MNGEIAPILCPPGEFTREAFPALTGPEIFSMNADGTVAGDDEGVESLYGFVQTADGTCTHFQAVPHGSTLAFGISDQGAVVGFYVDPQESGLRRVHGFLRDATGAVHRLDGPGPRDVVFPTAINTLGDIVGYLYQDVDDQNNYTYQAFVYRDGVFALVDSPTGEDLWLVDINNLGQVLGLIGVAGITGVRPFLLEDGEFREIQLPTAQTGTLLPTALNDLGQFVALDIEPLPGATPPFVAHQVLGTPQPSRRDRPHRRDQPRPHRREHPRPRHDVVGGNVVGDVDEGRVRANPQNHPLHRPRVVVLRAEIGEQGNQRAHQARFRSRISRVLLFSRNDSDTVRPSNILMMSRFCRTNFGPPVPG